VLCGTMIFIFDLRPLMNNIGLRGDTKSTKNCRVVATNDYFISQMVPESRLIRRMVRGYSPSIKRSQNVKLRS
jgi:hypothetical protein